MDACLNFTNLLGLEISHAGCGEVKELEERFLSGVQEDISKVMPELEKLKLLQKSAIWMLTPTLYNLFLLSAIMLGLLVRTAMALFLSWVKPTSDTPL